MANFAAYAFPPAPAITYFGTARDAFGNAIDSSAGAVVVLRSGGRIISEAPIDERLRTRENYRILIPLDLEDSDPYSSDVLTRGDLISISVRLPSGELPVAGISANAVSLEDPADRIRLDFFLGEDADNDGLPDSWEFSQLELAGILPTDPLFSLSTLDKESDFDEDGLMDGDEFIAGTFAFLQSDAVILRFVSHSIASDRLQTRFVFGKFYRLEASENLVDWRPVRMRITDSSDEGVFEMQSQREGDVDIQVMRPEGVPVERKLFYQLIVR